MAAIESLQALALARAALTSPMLVVGGGVVLWFVISAIVLKLSLTSASPLSVAIIAAMVAGVAAYSLGRPNRRDIEGPFGWVLACPTQRLYVAARRAGPILAASLAAFAVLTGVARPEAFGVWLPSAAVSAVLGGAAGVGVAALLPITASDWTVRASGIRLRFDGHALGLILSIGLILAAARLSAQGATAGAQLLASLAVGAAVLPTLAVDARRLTLRAQGPLSMTQVLLPGLARPALTAAIAALAAGAVVGLAAMEMLGLILVLAFLAALARLFLALAALGRSDRTAATAGWVELTVAAVLPTAGPAAVGPLAILWVLFRLTWLWRRGARVRWLDAGEA